MKINQHIENGILVFLLVAVFLGNTTYSGTSLKTLKEQERYRVSKEYTKVQEKTLQEMDRDYLSTYIKNLNETDISSEDSSNQSLLSNSSKEKNGADNSIISSYNVRKKKNSDTVGWIKIDGTQVDYPIMYSSDNNYYLKRTPDKVASQYGSIFLDQQSNGQWGVFNLIHGHNMNNGSMFADIAKMMDPTYLEKHKTFKVYDGSTYKEYTAFCCMKLNDKEEGIAVQYSSMEEYYKKLDGYMKRSRYLGKYPKDCTDFVILNTCWYGDRGGEKNLHAIIIAYRSK